MRTFVISYDEAPKSINHGGTGSRQHWSAAHREKQRWEGIYGLLLIERRVPRGMQRCTVQAWLEFRHRNRRDPENYRSSVSKPLADALVKGGWLEDDTAETFELTGFWIDSGVQLGPNPAIRSRVTVHIEAEYEDVSRIT